MRDGPGPASSSTEHAQRRRAEAEIVEILRAEGFCGENFERWRIRLVREVLARLTNALQSGAAFADRRVKWINPSPDAVDRLRHDRHEAEVLANEMVQLALAPFVQAALVNKGWSPDGGSTVAEFFYGAALQRLAQAYRSWQNSQLRVGPELVTLVEDPDRNITRFPSRPGSDEADGELSDMLTAIHERHKPVARLLCEGYKPAEIASLLGMPVQKVYKIKQQIKKSLTRAGYGSKIRRDTP